MDAGLTLLRYNAFDSTSGSTFREKYTSKYFEMNMAVSPRLSVGEPKLPMYTRTHNALHRTVIYGVVIVSRNRKRTQGKRRI